jgi:MarR family
MFAVESTTGRKENRMADLLETTRRNLETRLEELRPLVAEVEQLERALVALDGLDGPATEKQRRPRTRGGTSAQRGNDGRLRAPRGQRRTQVLEALEGGEEQRPADIAKRLGISSNQVSVLLGGLDRDGLAERRGRGRWAAAQPS